MIRNVICIGLLGLGAATINGCAIVNSEQLGAKANSIGAAHAGINYMLPKAMLPIQVIDNNGALRIDALEPIVVGDPEYSYALHYVPSAFSTDTVKIEVDPKTSLLKTVTLDSKDETGEVLKKVTALAFRPESADGVSEIVVYQGILDPSDTNSGKNLQEAVNTALRARISTLQAQCKSVTNKSAACAEYNALQIPKVGLPVAIVKIRPLGNESNRESISHQLVDCTIGICYRGTVPYKLSLSLLGQSRETILQLPNHAPVMALALERQPFVTVNHTVVLKDGILQSYDATKPSSALAIVSWPLDVFDAIVTTTSKILQLKIDTSKKSVEFEQQLLEEAKAKKAIQDELDKLRQPKPEGFGLLKMGGASKAILTVRVGKVQPTNLPGQGAGFNSNNNNGGIPVPTVPPTLVNPGSDGK